MEDKKNSQNSAKDPRMENKEYCPVCGKLVEKGIWCGNANCPYKNIQLNS